MPFLAILAIMSDTWRGENGKRGGGVSMAGARLSNNGAQGAGRAAAGRHPPAAGLPPAAERPAPRWGRSSARRGGCACRAEPSGSCPCHCCACDPWWRAAGAPTPSLDLRGERSVGRGGERQGGGAGSEHQRLAGAPSTTPPPGPHLLDGQRTEAGSSGGLGGPAGRSTQHFPCLLGPGCLSALALPAPSAVGRHRWQRRQPRSARPSAVCACRRASWRPWLA